MVVGLTEVHEKKKGGSMETFIRKKNCLYFIFSFSNQVNRFMGFNDDFVFPFGFIDDV